MLFGDVYVSLDREYTYEAVLRDGFQVMALRREKGTGEESRSRQLDAQSVAHSCHIERPDPDGQAGSEVSRRDHWVGTNSASVPLS